MKKYFMMAAIVLFAATSCTNESELTEVENNAEQATAPVTVRVSDFSMSMDDMSSGGGLTRAAVDAATYDRVGAMTLAFYDTEGNEVYKTTQVKDDNATYTTFGQFTANLPVDNYTMVALGYTYRDDDVFTLTSPTEAAFTSERPREMFCATQAVSVTSASPLDLDVTLNRISAKLIILSTDSRPVSAAKIRTTFAKGGKGFNPTTGFSLTDTGFSLINNPSAAVGTSITVNIFPFLYADEEKMDVTIEALDNDENVLITKVVNNVPLKRNYVTTLRGAVFTAGISSATFKIETEWGEGETVDF